MDKLRFHLNTLSWWLVGILVLVSGVLAGSVWRNEYQTNLALLEADKNLAAMTENTSQLSDWVDQNPGAELPEYVEPPLPQNIDGDPILPPPPPVDWAELQARGCVADGFLSGYGGDVESSIALINRSECYYLHRALETWLKPPDIKLARKIKAQVTRPNTVYGMFLAEAISTKSDYYYPYQKRPFDFDKMCREGSKNAWGEHTCKPSLEKKEYQRYVRYITEQAMDMGVQVFLFGQVFYQDSPDPSKTNMPEMIAEMRHSAKERGIQIVIGAQTNDITDPGYLKLFDFIEGGVGLSAAGTVEEGACFSRWYHMPGDWCWALLWHDQFQSHAKHVLVHFDWSGKIGDDMSIFTRMTADKRKETLTNLQKYFQKQGVGFLMPYLATLHKDNGGCHGAKKRFYSASRKYTCNDEEVINTLLREE
jgi:hypothetical protein